MKSVFKGLLVLAVSIVGLQSTPVMAQAIAAKSFLTFGEVSLVNGVATDTLTTAIGAVAPFELTVNDISIEGTDASDFSVTSSTPFTLAAGDSLLVPVALSATTVGRKDASLVITYTSNDFAGGGETTIALHANIGYERVIGSVVAWGGNVPAAVDVPEGLTDVVAIAGGYKHSLALKSDGKIVRSSSSERV